MEHTIVIVSVVLGVLGLLIAVTLFVVKGRPRPDLGADAAWRVVFRDHRGLVVWGYDQGFNSDEAAWEVANELRLSLHPSWKPEVMLLTLPALEDLLRLAKAEELDLS